MLWAGGLVDGSVVVNGGTVVADAGGQVYGSLVLLGSGGLVRQGGAVSEDIYELPLDELFAGAVSVASEDELRAACENGGVSAIRIEGDVVISENLTAGVPVLVAEGVSLASKSGTQVFLVEGAPLVNDGTVECSLQLGGGSPLLLNRGACLSTEELLVKVWGYETETEPGAVWVYVSALRRRLAAVGSRVRIRARRGVGYTLEADDA